MSDYEFNQAEYNLEEVKESLHEYLNNCYYADEANPKEAANKTFKYLENIVEDIIKKKPYSVRFGKGGSPLWHVSILKHLSEWVEAEYVVCKMLSKQLDSNLKENDGMNQL